jgi:UDP-N-acetyl-D-mannosaminuronate dehydrogenase
MTVGSTAVRTPADFLSRNDARSARIGVIGLGYVGLPLVLTDHSDYDYARIVRGSQLVVDGRNATRGIQASNIVLI